MNDFDFNTDYFLEEEIQHTTLSAKELAARYSTGELLTALENKGMAIRAIYHNEKWHKPRLILQ